MVIESMSKVYRVFVLQRQLRMLIVMYKVMHRLSG